VSGPEDPRTARGGPPPGGHPPPGGYPPPGGHPPPGGYPPPGGSSPPGGGAGGPPRPQRVGNILPLRPLTVADILDGSFGVLRRIFVPALILLLVLVGPVQLLSNLLLQRVQPAAFSPFFELGAEQVPLVGPDIAALLGLGSLLGLVGFVVNIITGAAVVALALHADRGDEPDAMQAVRDALGRFWAITGATLLVVLGGLFVLVAVVLAAVAVALIPVLGVILIVVGFLPLGMLGFLLWVAISSLLVPVAMVERGGPIVTLQRVGWILRRRFWRVLGITALVGLVVMAVSVGLGLTFGIAVAFAGPVAWILQTISDVLLSSVLVPVTGVAALLVYLDTRVREEGLDLQVRAGGMVPW
jgi:hypothetical protein